MKDKIKSYLALAIFIIFSLWMVKRIAAGESHSRFDQHEIEMIKGN